jgi:RNA polymerase sigma-70 factor (ECF subfamily)
VRGNDPKVVPDPSLHNAPVKAAQQVVGEQIRWEDEPSFSFIIERARELDNHALGLLYERYLPLIYRFIYLRVADTHIAEDVTSDVFFSVLAHIQQVHASDELAFAAWILRIARNAVIAHYRNLRAHPPSEPVTEVTLFASAEEGDPLTVILAREDWAQVVTAINALTEDQRVVILYRCLLGCSTEEVARLLEKRPGAVRALQFRALASLVRLLDLSAGIDEDAIQIPMLALGRQQVYGT